MRQDDPVREVLGPLGDSFGERLLPFRNVPSLGVGPDDDVEASRWEQFKY